MGIDDDARNKAEEMKGRGKEAAGSLTDNEDLKEEGKGDQGMAQGKQKVADAADAVKGKVDDVKNKLTGKN
ncbi:CsbD family protein [Gordonia sp. HNM0687]|uniref:CsbD family protein n=1 Tax=Gordonia mangrovi TaxID=2665643 RepID=A0A6L7GNY0_9ACTN|nr:CsbD family protein [Gordonia mangrovi]MDY6810816.1 CsbD family protein [Actinomycetota bacterium]MXP21624.1 CsbD family protein [Gordonia mangrovi]UVF80364.1 CsbD family protein [Gordonia mangrovi]